MNVPMQVASDYGIWYKHSDNIGLSLGKLWGNQLLGN